MFIATQLDLDDLDYIKKPRNWKSKSGFCRILRTLIQKSPIFIMARLPCLHDCSIWLHFLNVSSVYPYFDWLLNRHWLLYDYWSRLNYYRLLNNSRMLYNYCIWPQYCIHCPTSKYSTSYYSWGNPWSWMAMMMPWRRRAMVYSRPIWRMAMNRWHAI